MSSTLTNKALSYAAVKCRGRQRKTQPTYTEEDVKLACDMVMKDGISVRQAAKKRNIPHKTLDRRVKRLRAAPLEKPMLKHGKPTILTTEMETAMTDYIKFRAKICYGLTGQEVRQATYQFAVKNSVTVPESWHRNKSAGEEWFIQFRMRHPSLSLRKPEPCSLSRATAFNKHNVSAFFDNLVEVLTKYPDVADGTRIFNLDETALPTVQTPQKVVAGKETRRLNKAVSAERGTLVTGCCIICANGSYLPPALIFPRQNFKSHMTTGAPTGTLGLAHKTGWMTGDQFLEVMKHFVKHSHSSKENRSLLIFDNHESHLTIDVINYARDNGVIILTIPPHCSNKLQPLDVGVYKSLKNSYNAAMDSWMLMHPGETVTIYDVAGIFHQAFLRAMTPTNITSSFRSTGIYPLDRDIFCDDDFLTSFVTDRPLIAAPASAENSGTPSTVSVSLNLSNNIPTEEPSPTFTDPGSSNKSFVSPEEVLGLPKAKPRKTINSSRVRKTVIATSTPEKQKIEKRAKKIAEKRAKPSVLSRKRKREVKSEDRQFHIEDSFSEDDPEPLSPIIHKSKKKGKRPRTMLANSASATETRKKSLEDDFFCQVNDFCVVKFKMNETDAIKHYVGQILEIKVKKFCISFLRKTIGVNRFSFPHVPDIEWVKKEDIVEKVMPMEIEGRPTARQGRIISFYTNVCDNFQNVW